jgi:phosphoribosylanthranilate isomerase
VSNGLADITADIAALQAAVADVASTADVTALQAAIAAAQADLDDLLANSSVFNDNVVVNSSSSLDAFLAMGSTLNIINGTVTISTNSNMDATKVQSLVDNILTVTGDFTFTGASTEAVPTFKNLTGVQSLTVTGAGDYRFDNLQSAGNIVLNNDSAKTTIVHFGSLTSYSSITDDAGTANTVSMPNAKEFHLTSLGVLPNSALTLTIDEGGVLAHGLTGKKADGTDDTITLSLNGPKSVTLSTIVDGTITAANVETLSISKFRGSVDINAGVETLTLDGAVGNSAGAVDIAGATDLVTLNVTGALDSDPTLSTADKVGPTVTVTSAHKDLTDITLAGVLGAVSIAEAPKVATIAITADLNGAALTVDDLDDLTSITTKGAKIGGVTFQDNDEITVAEFAHTTETSAATVLGVTVSVTGNTNLETFHFFADDVKSLTLQTNAKLSKIDFTGLKDLGGATTATVLVSGNKLSASAVADAYDATPATSDTGSYTSTSGMSTLKTYLTAAMAATGAKNIGVYFDTLEGVTEQLTSVTTAYTQKSHTDSVSGTGLNAVAYSVTTAESGTTVRETETWLFDTNENALYATKPLNDGEGVSVTYGGVEATYVQGTSPAISTVADIVAAINNDTTTFGSGITVTAGLDAEAVSRNVLSYTTSTGTDAITASTGTILYSFGTATGTVTIGYASTTADIASQLAAAITNTVVSGVEYGASASGKVITVTRMITNTNKVDKGINTSDFPDIAITLNDSTTVDFSANTTTNSTGANSDFFISFTQSNVNALRVTVKNNSIAVALSAVVTAVSPGGALADTQGPTELISGTNMAANTNYDASFSEISNVTAASTTTKSRVSWLG